MKKYLVIVLFICLISNLFAAHSKVGTTGATFLKIGAGSRPMGMGGAFVGVADDINSIYWNPAGLSNISNNQALLQHIEWFQDINHEYAAYATPFGNKNAFGIAVTYLSMDSIEKRSSTNNSDIPDGTFGASDLAAIMCYSKAFNNQFSFGVSAKYITQTIDIESASSIATDIGLLYKLNYLMNLGVAVQNLGTSIKFVEDDSELPLNIKAGLGLIIKPEVFTIGFDVNYPNDYNMNFCSGLELVPKLFRDFYMPLRVGYKTKNDFESNNSMSAGIGFQKSDYSLDFAWIPYGDLGNTYRVSLMIRWKVKSRNIIPVKTRVKKPRYREPDDRRWPTFKRDYYKYRRYN